MGLTLIPAPTTLHELYVQNFYVGYMDALSQNDVLVNGAGTPLDDAVVMALPIDSTRPRPDGCIAIAQANTRNVPCDSVSPLGFQPVCLIP